MTENEKQKIRKIFQDSYNEHLLCDPDATKYEWIAGDVFNLTTYDGSLDELFTTKIIEVCKVILNRENFDYIRDDTNYIPYILVCQVLKNLNWIEWGTSIRGAWFERQCRDQCLSEPILKHWTQEDGWMEIPFTIENLKALIEFVEEDSNA